MKGQFMLIASILIGFIVISAASTISQVQSTEFKSSDLSNTIQIIKQEAEKVDHGDETEIQNYRAMISMITDYQTQVVHWDLQSCFNVTLESPEGRAELNCI